MAVARLAQGEGIKLAFAKEETPISLSGGFASFFPVLIKALALTDGPILELGTGLYSTPYLHWFSFMSNRPLVSYENSEIYARLASQYASDLHKVYQVDSYDEIPDTDKWDVALIDTFPLEDREAQLKRLSNFCNYVIVHDTQPGAHEGVCKYRLDYIKAYPHTTVFSNIIDVTNLQI